MSIFTATKNMKSRVKGDFHARFCENVGVKFPCVTRLANIMKEYNFNYTDQRLLFIIIIICILIMFGEMTLIHLLLFDITEIGNTESLAMYLFVLIIPGVIIMKSKKWVNKQVTAVLTQNELELKYKSKTQTVKFDEIVKVQVDHFNGVLLRISTQSKKKIKFAANDLTTSPSELREFSKDLKYALEKFNLTENKNEVQLPKNILEKKLGLYLLIGTSIVMVLVVAYIYSIGKSLSGVLIGSFGVLSSLWTGYLIQKK